MVEGETEASKEHRLVASPGPRRHVWPRPLGLPEPLFCFFCHFAEPCLTHKGSHQSHYRLPSVLIPVLPGTLSGSTVDCTVVRSQ